MAVKSSGSIPPPSLLNIDSISPARRIPLRCSRIKPLSRCYIHHFYQSPFVPLTWIWVVINLLVCAVFFESKDFFIIRLYLATQVPIRPACLKVGGRSGHEYVLVVSTADLVGRVVPLLQDRHVNSTPITNNTMVILTPSFSLCTSTLSEAVDRPKVEQAEFQVLNEDQAQQFLIACTGSEFEAIFYLARTQQIPSADGIYINLRQMWVTHLGAFLARVQFPKWHSHPCGAMTN